MTKHHFKLDPNDFIILVVGLTGTGKTHFINILTGNAEQRGADNLKSDTQNVTPYPILYRGHRLVLVDTPGFDNTHRDNLEVLSTISDWLTQKYADGTTIKVTGIIYLHRITDSHMTHSAYKILQVFDRLCGDIALPRARLVTTMWDRARDQTVAENRETQLMGEFWQKLLKGGAVARRFDNTQTCAWDIVRELVALGKGTDELLLQEELVKQQKHLRETEACKILYPPFQQLLAEQKKTLKDLMDEAMLANDPAMVRSLQEEYDNVDVQLQQLFEKPEMNTPFYTRALHWLSGGKSRAQAVKLEA